MYIVIYGLDRAVSYQVTKSASCLLALILENTTDRREKNKRIFKQQTPLSVLTNPSRCYIVNNCIALFCSNKISMMCTHLWLTVYITSSVESERQYLCRRSHCNSIDFFLVCLLTSKLTVLNSLIQCLCRDLLKQGVTNVVAPFLIKGG